MARAILSVLALMFAFPLGAFAQAEGKKYALLVGVAKYDGTGLNNLKYAEKDMHDLAEALNALGYKVTLVTRAEYKKTDKDFHDPTAENVRDHLAAITADRKADDTVLVAFSGHGVHLKETDKLYYCPTKTKLDKPETMVEIDAVMDALGKCKANSKVLLMDACRNDPSDGKAVTDKKLKSTTLPLIPDPVGGTVALFSCSTGQISHESEKFEQGFMMHFVIDALKGKAANPKTGAISWDKLVGHVKDEVPEAVAEQKGPSVKQRPQSLGKANILSLGTVKVEGNIITPPPMKETIDLAKPKDGEERLFEIADGMKMVFCWIPPGKAALGSPASDKVFGATEIEHEYTSKGFWMGKYAVTQKEYESVVGVNPSYFSQGGQGADYVKGLDTSRFPVEQVSWNDCQAFIKKCKMKGLKLPQQDEWEYACRGGLGNARPFYWGDSLKGDMANCNGEKPFGTTDTGPYLQATTAVGSYAKVAPHPWGLCDMAGNVYQWCEDWSSNEQKYRVMRGGYWRNGCHGCRAAHSHGEEPIARSSGFGFRLCFVPE